MRGRDGRFAREILELQQENGMWGIFHTLSKTVPARSMSSEQALRRLEALGFTMEDACIARAVGFMRACLEGEQEMPDRREKVIDWDAFTELMLAAWIRRFTDGVEAANRVARKWAGILEAGYATGDFEEAAARAAFAQAYPKADPRKRMIDLFSFYPVSLLAGELDARVEVRYVDDLLARDGGIYYVCSGPLNRLPEAFVSKRTCDYLAAMALLAAYAKARERLGFVAAWIRENRDAQGGWDLGPKGKDGVHLPVADDWRSSAARREDCTVWVGGVLGAVEGSGG